MARDGIVRKRRGGSGRAGQEKESVWANIVAMGFFAVLVGGVIGTAWMFAPYVLAGFLGYSRYRSVTGGLLETWIDHDTAHGMNLRFLIGAAVGAIAAVGAWVRYSRDD